MAPYIPKPIPCFIDQLEFFRVIAGRKVYRGKNKGKDKFYSYDERHGEIEVFNRRGKHIGVVDAKTGKWIKDAVPGRDINVQ